MNLARVREGDIVEIDDTALCFVTEVIRQPRSPARLRLRSTTGKWSPPQNLTAYRVTRIWHANKHNNRRPAT